MKRTAHDTAHGGKNWTVRTFSKTGDRVTHSAPARESARHLRRDPVRWERRYNRAAENAEQHTATGRQNRVFASTYRVTDFPWNTGKKGERFISLHAVVMSGLFPRFSVCWGGGNASGRAATENDDFLWRTYGVQSRLAV